MSIEGAGVIAAAAAGFAAIAAFQRERNRVGIGFLVLSAFSRESCSSSPLGAPSGCGDMDGGAVRPFQFQYHSRCWPCGT
jgi:hypothetical protein